MWTVWEEVAYIYTIWTIILRPVSCVLHFGGQSGRRQPALWKIILNHDTGLQGKKFSGFCLAPGYINFVEYVGGIQGFILPQRTHFGETEDTVSGGQCRRRWPAFWKIIANP
jgi:hypothetical protein